MSQSLSLLDDITQRLGTMSEEDLKAVTDMAAKAVGDKVFIPSPGPQTDAYFCKADILLFGGNPGGGKTALEIGLGLNEHHRSLIVRPSFSDLEGVIDTAKKLAGTTTGFVGGGRPKYNKPNGGKIDFAGVAKDGTIGGHQGNDHDLICVDEAAQFPEAIVRLLMGWLRSDIKGQRCRMILGSNPPLTAVGDWLITFFAPWLDETYDNPAMPGELRWFLPDEDGIDRECGQEDFTMVEGREVYALSRTFIPSTHEDNPYYDSSEYAQKLMLLPKEVREILMSGNFMMARQDEPMQLIPTAWVAAAQERWTPQRPDDVPMCAMGVDVAQGGIDDTVLAPRYDAYFAELVVKPGVETKDGKIVAGFVVSERTDNAYVVIDMGGGYGGETYGILKDNISNERLKGHKGAEGSVQRTKDKQLKFFNKRSQVLWRFREALDPSQDGGSHVALPPDPELKADLTVVTYEVGSRGIKAMTKADVVKKLKRSPGRGDAVVMAWSHGDKIWNVQGGKFTKKHVPKVILGHANMKKRRR